MWAHVLEGQSTGRNEYRSGPRPNMIGDLLITSIQASVQFAPFVPHIHSPSGPRQTIWFETCNMLDVFLQAFLKICP